MVCLFISDGVEICSVRVSDTSKLFCVVELTNNEARFHVVDSVPSTSGLIVVSDEVVDSNSTSSGVVSGLRTLIPFLCNFGISVIT